MKKILFVIVGLALIVIIFLLGKNFGSGTNQSADNKASTATQKESTVVSSSLKEVVGKYMRATLGTIPQADVNYEKAKEYVTGDLKEKLDDPSFIPLSYGIQDGPSDIEFESEDINDGTATVIVSGIYGGTPQTKWQFDLILEGNNWKIAKITSLNQ